MGRARVVSLHLENVPSDDVRADIGVIGIVTPPRSRPRGRVST